MNVNDAHNRPRAHRDYRRGLTLLAVPPRAAREFLLVCNNRPHGPRLDSRCLRRWDSRRAHRHGWGRPDDADAGALFRCTAADGRIERPRGERRDEARWRDRAPAPGNRQPSSGRLPLHRLRAVGVLWCAHPQGTGRRRTGPEHHQVRPGCRAAAHRRTAHRARVSAAHRTGEVAGRPRREAAPGSAGCFGEGHPDHPARCRRWADRGNHLGRFRITHHHRVDDALLRFEGEPTGRYGSRAGGSARRIRGNRPRVLRRPRPRADAPPPDRQRARGVSRRATLGTAVRGVRATRTRLRATGLCPEDARGQQRGNGDHLGRRAVRGTRGVDADSPEQGISRARLGRDTPVPPGEGAAIRAFRRGIADVRPAPPHLDRPGPHPLPRRSR